MRYEPPPIFLHRTSELQNDVDFAARHMILAARVGAAVLLREILLLEPPYTLCPTHDPRCKSGSACIIAKHLVFRTPVRFTVWHTIRIQARERRYYYKTSGYQHFHTLCCLTHDPCANTGTPVLLRNILLLNPTHALPFGPCSLRYANGACRLRFADGRPPELSRPLKGYPALARRSRHRYSPRVLHINPTCLATSATDFIFF